MSARAPRRTWLAAALAVLMAAFVWAPAAQASPSGATTTKFDEGYVNPGEYIDAAYLTTTGVTFGTPATLGFPLSGPPGIGECDPSVLSASFAGSTPTYPPTSFAAGETSCGSGEFGPPAGFMFHLQYARTTVSFYLQALNSSFGQPETGANAIAYDHSGNAIAEVDLSAVQAGGWYQVTLTPSGAAPIQYVEVNGLGSSTGIELTDLVLPAAGNGLTPYWKLTDLKSLPVDFQNGMINLVAHDNETLTVPLQILRENGSTGAITVQASDGGAPNLRVLTVDNAPAGQPPDVVDLQLEPQPGFDGTFVNVTMSGSAPGTAGAYDGAPLVFHVAILPEFTLAASADPVGQGCETPIGLILTSLGAYSGPVTVTGADPTGTHHFSQVVNVKGPGQYKLTDGTSSGVALKYTVLGSGGIPVDTLSYTAPVATPELEPGSVTSQGTEGGTLKFAAIGLPCHLLVVRTSPTDGTSPTPAPSASSRGFTPQPTNVGASYVVTLNDYATSGPADVYDSTTGKSLFTLGEVSIGSFRNTYGFSWVNNDYGMRLDDGMEDELFGTDQTNINVLGWEVRKPEAWAFEQITNNHIPGGICFGMAYSSMEFYFFGSERAMFAPSSAPGGGFPWYFVGPGAPSDALLKYVTERFSLQFTDQLIPVALNASIGIHGTNDDINEIKAQVAQGPVPVGMANWNGLSLTGHTVLAYATKDLPDGSTAVLVANSNVPYLTSEESNYDSHVTREGTDSELIIKNGNWTFPQLGWSGSEADLVVYDHSQLPIINGQHPTLPSVFTSTPVLVFGSGGDAVTQVGGAGGSSLFKGGKLAPRSKWPRGMAPIPSFTSHGSPLQLVALSRQGASTNLTATVKRGSRGGAMAMELPGLEAELNAGSRPGAVDHVSVQAKNDTIAYSAGAKSTPLSGVLLTQPTAHASAAGVDPDQIIKFTLSSSSGGSDKLSDRHGAFTIDHRGAPTKLTLALSGFSAQGLPVQVTLPPVALRSGEALTASPNWHALSSARVRIATTIDGHTRRTTIRAKALSHAFARPVQAAIRTAGAGPATLDLKLSLHHRSAGQALSVLATVRSGHRLIAKSKPSRIVPGPHFSGHVVVNLSARPAAGSYQVAVRILELTSTGPLQSSAVVSHTFKVRVAGP